MKWTAAAILFLSATPAFAQEEHVGVRVREWFARMSGTIEGDDGSGNSSTLDLKDDLGLGDRHLTHEIQAYLRIPVVGRIYLGWWRAHDSGSETFTRTIDFAGVTFTSSDTVNTEVTLDVGYLTYEFAFPRIPIGDVVKTELAVQLGIRAMHGAGSIDETSGSQSGSDSGTVALPILGAHVTVELFEAVRAEVEVLGFAFSYADWHIHYLEASAEVVAQPLPWIFAGVGYKYVNLDFRHTGNERFLLDVGVAGLYVTVGVRF
jgi:hypothetical protein